MLSAPSWHVRHKFKQPKTCMPVFFPACFMFVLHIWILNWFHSLQSHQPFSVFC